MTNLQFSTMLGALTGVLGLIVTGGVIVAGVAYYRASARKGQNEANAALQGANEKLTDTLNQMLETQDKKISDLTMTIKESQNKISNLEGRVEELSKKNGDLQGIINKALDRYFELHPDEAVRLTTIKSSRRSDHTG